MPVVDANNMLVGMITHDDLVDVIRDEASEDILQLGAVEADLVMDKPYWSQTIYATVRPRFIWLLILFIAEMLTGVIMSRYEAQLQIVVALTFFILLLIGTGGNAVSQTISIVIRALALREIKPRDALRVWWREEMAGFLLGLITIGALGFITAMVWGVSMELAITVGISIFVICIWSTSISSLIPIFAGALKIDPTVISGPLMSTLIDTTGLVIYISQAILIVPQL